jgi:hypothetical protein
MTDVVKIFIGYDPAEAVAYNVLQHSIPLHTTYCSTASCGTPLFLFKSRRLPSTILEVFTNGRATPYSLTISLLPAF